jgi:hypothetical protein
LQSLPYDKSNRESITGLGDNFLGMEIFYIAVCLQTFLPCSENVFLVIFPDGCEVGVYFMDRTLSCVTYSLLDNVLLGFLWKPDT